MPAVFTDAIPRPTTATRWTRFLPPLLAILIVVGLTYPGIVYRRWAWDFTEPGRFRGDINRNFQFGLKAINTGDFNLYEDEIRDQPPVAKKLDYPPMRLFIFDLWARWTLRTHPDATEWSSEYEFSAPLMNFYTVLDWLGCAAAMLIVIVWLRRCDSGPDVMVISPWTGIVRGLTAFGLLWFNPAVVLVGHGWPSPNAWTIPLYLWAVLFCLCDFWFVAGLLYGVSVTMQGQMFFAAAWFVLWPLFAGRPAMALRWVSGFLLAFMIVVSPWMLSIRPDPSLPGRIVNWAAFAWCFTSIALLLAVAFRKRIEQRVGRRGPAIFAAMAILALALPPIVEGQWIAALLALIVTAGGVAVLWRCDWRIKRYVLPLTAGLSLLLCIPFFGASTAWWRIGFLYGVERFPGIGGVNNLASLLEQLTTWENYADTAFTLHWGDDAIDVTVRQMLVTIYVAFFVAGAAVMAWQWRRRGRNGLVAIALPWILFFTLLPQMSPRYAVFAAGVAAIFIGTGVGVTLMGFVLTIIAFFQTAQCMMYGYSQYLRPEHPLFSPQMHRLFEPLQQGLSWAEILAACACFAVAASRHPDDRKRNVRQTSGVQSEHPESQNRVEDSEVPARVALVDEALLNEPLPLIQISR